jgi:hypothetical protein
VEYVGSGRLGDGNGLVDPESTTTKSSAAFSTAPIKRSSLNVMMKTEMGGAVAGSDVCMEANRAAEFRFVAPSFGMREWRVGRVPSCVWGVQLV